MDEKLHHAEELSDDMLDQVSGGVDLSPEELEAARRRMEAAYEALCREHPDWMATMPRHSGFDK